MDKKTSFVFTNEASCVGCNKCIFVCPTKANEAFFENEQNKVYIKPGFCISCGECINICDHFARDYEDDTTTFFKDISNNENITAIIAPAARFNMGSITKLTGYLKSIGVNNVYDVSFGADICTWGHVKAIREQELSGVIAQPCPVIVSYVEKYKPELIDRLSPVHSPVMCLATYLKKYLGITDKLLFLSPCIGKKRECTTEHTYGLVEYNVTFLKLLEHLENNNINLEDYPDTDFDITDASLGFTFSRPGGLSENIKFNLGQDIWIKSVEGIKNIEHYFNELLLDIKENNPVPVVIDALNCEYGCNLGTGTTKKARLNQIDFQLNAKKSTLSKADSDKLMRFFDEKLKLSDFIREYTDRSFDYKMNADISLENAFISLGKITAEDREINCFSCGYGNCHEFAYDLATGHNNKNNCKYFLLNKFKRLSHYDDLTGLNNRNSFNTAIADYYENHPGFIGIIYVDINGLKQANDLHGHSFGDTLITSCANLLKTVYDEQAFRVGGDEFIVLYNISSSEDAFNKTVANFSTMLSKEKDLVASVGTSISYNSDDLSTKMDEADQKMYRAKADYYSSMRKQDRRKSRFLSFK